MAVTMLYGMSSFNWLLTFTQPYRTMVIYQATRDMQYHLWSIYLYAYMQGVQHLSCDCHLVCVTHSAPETTSHTATSDYTATSDFTATSDYTATNKHRVSKCTNQIHPAKCLLWFRRGTEWLFCYL